MRIAFRIKFLSVNDLLWSALDEALSKGTIGKDSITDN